MELWVVKNEVVEGGGGQEHLAQNAGGRGAGGGGEGEKRKKTMNKFINI